MCAPLPLPLLTRSSCTRIPRAVSTRFAYTAVAPCGIDAVRPLQRTRARGFAPALGRYGFLFCLSSSRFASRETVFFRSLRTTFFSISNGHTPAICPPKPAPNLPFDYSVTEHRVGFTFFLFIRSSSPERSADRQACIAVRVFFLNFFPTRSEIRFSQTNALYTHIDLRFFEHRRDTRVLCIERACRFLFSAAVRVAFHHRSYTANV